MHKPASHPGVDPAESFHGLIGDRLIRSLGNRSRKRAGVTGAPASFDPARIDDDMHASVQASITGEGRALSISRMRDGGEDLLDYGFILVECCGLVDARDRSQRAAFPS